MVEAYPGNLQTTALKECRILCPRLALHCCWQPAPRREARVAAACLPGELVGRAASLGRGVVGSWLAQDRVWYLRGTGSTCQSLGGRIWGQCFHRLEKPPTLRGAPALRSGAMWGPTRCRFQPSSAPQFPGLCQGHYFADGKALQSSRGQTGRSLDPTLSGVPAVGSPAGSGPESAGAEARGPSVPSREASRRKL